MPLVIPRTPVAGGGDPLAHLSGRARGAPQFVITQV